MKRTIVVQLQVPGFHKWPEAPRTVYFLSKAHRHIFTFRLHFKVDHNNRDLEFFMTRDALHHHVYSTYEKDEDLGGDHLWFGENSCESLAEELLQYFKPDGIYKCEVWEDNENGAILEVEG